MEKKSSYDNLLIIGAGFFAAIMVIFPEETQGGAKEGLYIWLNSVVPILFPFFIFSDFMKRMGVADRAPTGLYPFIMAFMSGYPMGAKIVGDMVVGGKLSKTNGKAVLSYSLITGPAFILGTLGGFLGSSKAGLVVALAHYLGALLNSFFYNVKGKQELSLPPVDSGTKVISFDRNKKTDDNSSPMEKFTLSILNSTRSMAIILAYLVVFMIGIQLLSRVGLFSLIGNEMMSSFLKGILEMTIGSKTVCMSVSNIPLRVSLVSFFVSFGGISVIGQSSSMLSRSGITFFDVLQIKTTHGLISGIIAVIFGSIML